MFHCVSELALVTQWCVLQHIMYISNCILYTVPDCEHRTASVYPMYF